MDKNQIKLTKVFKEESENYNQTQPSNKINVLDFRYFDVQNFQKNIILSININFSYIDKKLLKLFEEIEATIIYPKNDEDNSESENEKKLEVDIFSTYIEKIGLSIENAKKTIKNKLNIKESEIILFLYIDIDYNNIFFEILNLLHTLKNDPVKIFIINNNSILCPLKSGMNNIYLSNSLFTTKGIGLLPLEESIISTRGLRWDVTDYKTKFSTKDVSTSNETCDEGSLFNVFINNGYILLSLEIDSDKINFI
jgi:hypothetical protein